jgi:hypothetical protein
MNEADIEKRPRRYILSGRVFSGDFSGFWWEKMWGFEEIYVDKTDTGLVV